MRDRQGIAPRGLDVAVDGDMLRLGPAACARVRDRARDKGLMHNQARAQVERMIIDALAREAWKQVWAEILEDPGVPDEEELAALRQELRENAAVWSAIDEFWPVLSPQQLLEDLFASPERLAAAAPGLTAAQRSALLRPRGGGWTAADVPLLDEAAEVLGEDDRRARERAAADHQRRLAYAQGVLDVAYGSRSVDLEGAGEEEILSAFDLVDPALLADRYHEVDVRSAVERAAADRAWTYGHVIVDEAQELSPMAWRMLMRRCPTRSMTLVGDMAQTSDATGAPSWRAALAPHVADRWRLERLTINYRTPAEIAEVAADVLAQIDPELRPPRPVRETGVRPWRCQAGPEGLGVALPVWSARNWRGRTLAGSRSSCPARNWRTCAGPWRIWFRTSQGRTTRTWIAPWSY